MRVLKNAIRHSVQKILQPRYQALEYQAKGSIITNRACRRGKLGEFHYIFFLKSPSGFFPSIASGRLFLYVNQLNMNAIHYK